MYYVLISDLCAPQAELNTKNSTKRQLCCRLVEFLVFNSIHQKKVSHPTRRVVQTSFLHFWIRNFWTVPQAKSNLINASFCFNIWDPYAKESSPRGLGWGPSMNKKKSSNKRLLHEKRQGWDFFQYCQRRLAQKKAQPPEAFRQKPLQCLSKTIYETGNAKKNNTLEFLLRQLFSSGTLI